MRPAGSSGKAAYIKMNTFRTNIITTVLVGRELKGECFKYKIDREKKVGTFYLYDHSFLQLDLNNNLFPYRDQDLMFTSPKANEGEDQARLSNLFRLFLRHLGLGAVRYKKLTVVTFDYEIEESTKNRITGSPGHNIQLVKKNLAVSSGETFRLPADYTLPILYKSPFKNTPFANAATQINLFSVNDYMKAEALHNREKQQKKERELIKFYEELEKTRVENEAKELTKKAKELAKKPLRQQLSDLLKVKKSKSNSFRAMDKKCYKKDAKKKEVEAPTYMARSAMYDYVTDLATDIRRSLYTNPITATNFGVRPRYWVNNDTLYTEMLIQPIQPVEYININAAYTNNPWR